MSDLLSGIGPVKVAVSGGVDSMTLGVLASRSLGGAALICHAISAAVPAEATERVRQFAEREGWNLRLLDAGEFANPDYLRNPYDRCFHCKNSLYTAMGVIAECTPGSVMLSGTNQDDLSDYRPGLIAAKQHGVRHPFVECGVDKAGIRGIARHLGYGSLAELPASPCLSSRIETGLPINVEQLALVHRIERSLQQSLNPAIVRCRIQAGGIAIQLDAATLERLHSTSQRWRSELEELAGQLGLPRSVRFVPYRMGSAFVPPK